MLGVEYWVLGVEYWVLMECLLGVDGMFIGCWVLNVGC